MDKRQKKQLNNIYDLIKGAGLSDKQKDNWAVLSRKHEKEAKKELKQFLRDKDIAIDLDNGVITIGKKFTLKLSKEQ